MKMSAASSGSAPENWNSQEEEVKAPAPRQQPVDDVEKALLAVVELIRNPIGTLRRFFLFVKSALELSKTLYRPAVGPTLARSVVVLLVVVLFCIVVNGVDALVAWMPRYFVK